MIIKRPLQIPSVWRTLLEMPDFDELPDAQYPIKLRGVDITTTEHVFDPRPYRDDARCAEVVDGNIKVVYSLFSGNNNYWLACEVFRKDDADTSFDEAEPIHEDPDSCSELDQAEDEIETLDGDVIWVPIVLVDNPVA